MDVKRKYCLLFLLVLVPLVLNTTSAEGEESDQDVDRSIELIGKEYKFEPNELEVQAGRRIEIVFRNEGTIAHDFHIKELDFKTEPIQPGNQTAYTFTAPESDTTIQFACKVAGHEPAGMKGKIVVKEPSTAEKTGNNSSEDGSTSAEEERGSEDSEKKTSSIGTKQDNMFRKRFQERREADLREGWGAVQGTVVLDGEKPEPYKNEGAEVFEKQCDLHGAFEVHHVQVNEDNGGLKGTLVYVREVDSVRQSLRPPETVRIVQEKCRFHPSVQVVRTGGRLKLINADPSVHNFKYDSLGELSFGSGNITQRGNSDQSVVDHVKVDAPGVYGSVCNVHPWMNGLFLAIDHHAYDVTGEKGTFQIQLPPGEYTFHVQHYTQQSPKQVNVTVPKGRVKDTTVSLDLK